MSEKKVKAAEPAAPGFEKALERLEKLVAEMESGDLDLEKMIGHFEEGQSLIKLCTARLNEVERKIEVLIRKEDGSVDAEPFEASAAGEPSRELESPAGGDDLF